MRPSELDAGRLWDMRAYAREIAETLRGRSFEVRPQLRAPAPDCGMWHGWLVQPWIAPQTFRHGWTSQPCHSR